MWRRSGPGWTMCTEICRPCLNHNLQPRAVSATTSPRRGRTSGGSPTHSGKTSTTHTDHNCQTLSISSIIYVVCSICSILYSFLDMSNINVYDLIISLMIQKSQSLANSSILWEWSVQTDSFLSINLNNPQRREKQVLWLLPIDKTSTL